MAAIPERTDLWIRRPEHGLDEEVAYVNRKMEGIEAKFKNPYNAQAFKDRIISLFHYATQETDEAKTHSFRYSDKECDEAIVHLFNGILGEINYVDQIHPFGHDLLSLKFEFATHRALLSALNSLQQNKLDKIIWSNPPPPNIEQLYSQAELAIKTMNIPYERVRELEAELEQAIAGGMGVKEQSDLRKSMNVEIDKLVQEMAASYKDIIGRFQRNEEIPGG